MNAPNSNRTFPALKVLREVVPQAEFSFRIRVYLCSSVVQLNLSGVSETASWNLRTPNAGHRRNGNQRIVHTAMKFFMSAFEVVLA